MTSLIRPSGTFSRKKCGRRQLSRLAFSRSFQREKVPEGRMRESVHDANSTPPHYVSHSMNRRTLLKLSATGLGLAALGGLWRNMTNAYYSGPKSDHYDGTRFFVPGEPELNSPLRLLKWQFGGEPRATWPASVANDTFDAPPERQQQGLRSTLIGHASFLVQAAGLNILIDPVYSERVSPVSFAGPKRVRAPGLAFDRLPPIDVVLVTHGHYDHLDLATLGRLHQRFKPRYIAPLGNDAVMAATVGGRDNVKAYDWGQSVDLGQGVTVHLVPSYHWSARGLFDRRKTLWASFVLTTPSGTLYHIGDTGYGAGKFSKDVRKQFGPVGLAHIPIGAYEPRWFMKGQHVNPEESVRIFEDCGAAQAIGHHWGTFQLTNEAIDQPLKDLTTAKLAAKIAPEIFPAFTPGQFWLSA
jgi:L-ascorbate metabolism protein UlaG (beta-lactamase superfamily)